MKSSHLNHMKLASIALAATVLLAPHASVAGVRAAEYGPRFGMSSDPGQIVVGGQVEFPEFAPNLTVDPNIEIGFLDHQTVIAMNADFLYHFAIQGSAWSPYAGLGVGINVFQYDSGTYPGLPSQTNAGGNVVLGASAPTHTGNRFFAELRAGLGDIPSLKLMAGWNFRM